MASDDTRTIIITETRNLRTLSFRHTEDQLLTGKAWEEWLEEIERKFRYFRINDPQDKKDALIIYGGKEIARLEKSLPDPTGEPNVYQKLRKKLNTYFLPKRNKHYALYVFLKMKPMEGESTVSYATRLWEKAQDCEFGNNLDDRILEHLIQTIESETLIQKCIAKGWSLSEFLSEAGQCEEISLQMRDMKTKSTEREVARVDGYDKWRNDEKRHGKNRKTEKRCGNCGLAKTHRDRADCPAYGKHCNRCRKLNHFAAVCRADEYKQALNSRQRDKRQGQRGRNDIKKATEYESDSPNSSDEEFITQSNAHMTVKKVKRRYSLKKTVPLTINDVSVRAEPDSGAEVNVMDEYQYRALKYRSNTEITLKQTETKLQMLQTEFRLKENSMQFYET